MHMAENGFCKDGDQEAMLREGVTGIDGRMPMSMSTDRADARSNS